MNCAWGSRAREADWFGTRILQNSRCVYRDIYVVLALEKIFATNALTGQGLDRAIDWLADILS